MTFDASKPDASESPDQFPTQCQDNWSRLKTIISSNHEFNDGAAASDGKHKFVVMPEQSSAATTAANEMALYTKETTSISEVFLRRESDGTEIQMTSGAVTDTTAQAANGYSCLPGGLLLQWGIYTAPSGTSGNLSFPTTFGAIPYSVTMTIIRVSSASNSKGYGLVLSATPTTTTFKVNSGFTNSHTFYMMAIGKAV